MKFQYKSFLLAEAYTRSDNVDWLEVFEKIKLFVNQEIPDEAFHTYMRENNLGFDLIWGREQIGGYFDLENRRVVIECTDDVLETIMTSTDKDQLKRLAQNFWTNFCHEDTHRQQQSKSKIDLYKNYRAPESLDWNEDLGKSLDYFDQHIEADAYGREIGARLRTKYPKKAASSIFLDINVNKIDDAYCKKIINVYKDPRMSKKSNHDFFRALYDFFGKQ